MKALTLLSTVFLVALSAGANERHYPASNFKLIPESEAHRSFGVAARRALDPHSIKVLVWNIKKGQEPGLDRDLPAYGKDRDLLIISEGYLNPLGQGIFDTFSTLHWDMGISFLYAKDHDFPTGTLIGSVVPPTWTKVKQTVDHEPFIDTPKCLTFAKYPIAGSLKKLLVISMHGINAVLPEALERHVALAVAEIEKHDGPVIFAGDFNTNLETKVEETLKTISDLGMQSLEFRNDERKLVGGNIIDYIFTRGLHPKDSEVLGKLTSSDHKAMLAELEVDPD